jgi:hypothetical protein
VVTPTVGQREIKTPEGTLEASPRSGLVQPKVVYPSCQPQQVWKCNRT